MQRVQLSEVRTVWLMTMFDLPVDTDADKKAANSFRKFLLDQGFSRFQYSVYARPCPSEDAAETHRRRIRAALPAKGEVRILSMTDLQISKMEIYLQSTKKGRKGEPDPRQLLMF